MKSPNPSIASEVVGAEASGHEHSEDEHSQGTGLETPCPVFLEFHEDLLEIQTKKKEPVQHQKSSKKKEEIQLCRTFTLIFIGRVTTPIGTRWFVVPERLA